MAPIAISPSEQQQVGLGKYNELALGPQGYQKDVEESGSADQPRAQYKKYLPTWNPDRVLPPLEPFKHVEHGLGADPSFPELLGSSAKVVELTPTIGSEIRGIQLSSLSDKCKDQLALLVAQRKVLVFHDQDFADLPISEAREIGKYFGRLHIHPTSGAPENHPEVHVVHRGAGDSTFDTFFATRTSSVAWHSDVTYERQPPGTTFLYILDQPESGGDTLFVNQVQAYRRLSPEFRKRLHGLKAVHSGIEQADISERTGGVVRRTAVTSVHPVVRTHPATGEKALFVNPQFTRHIVGYKKEESDALLKFLFDHLSFGADFQARVKWAAKSAVVWDNRVTAHSALLDWLTPARRHLARITPQAEEPFETPFVDEGESE